MYAGMFWPWVWRQSRWPAFVNTGSGSAGGQRKTHPPTHRWTGSEVPSSGPVQDDQGGGGGGGRGHAAERRSAEGGGGGGGGAEARREARWEETLPAIVRRARGRTGTDP